MKFKAAVTETYWIVFEAASKEEALRMVEEDSLPDEAFDTCNVISWDVDTDSLKEVVDV